jgi:cystathionine beta-lyase
LVNYAHQKGAYVFVDNSCVTGYWWNPLSVGVDFCVESLARTTNGYNNSLLGFLIINSMSTINIELKNKLLDSIRYFGFYPHPIDCYLTILGLQTLSLRLDQIYKTTNKICEYLSANNVVFNAIKEGGLIFIKIP